MMPVSVLVIEAGSRVSRPGFLHPSPYLSFKLETKFLLHYYIA
jgi:hypothetical protein